MHKRTFRGNVLIFLFFSIFFIFFSPNFTYAITDCSFTSGTLGGLANNKVMSLTYDISCGTGFNFKNYQNLTFICNRYDIIATSSSIIYVNDSNLKFIGCDIIFSAGKFIDNNNSNISFSDTTLSSLNYAQTKGNYSISKKITIDVKNFFSESISDFKINFSSNSQDYEKISNLTTDYFPTIFYVNGSVNKTYNNYTITANSSTYGSSNFTNLNLSQTNIVSLKLLDLISPKVNTFQVTPTNQSLNINLIFNELVNGTLRLHNSTGSIIQTKNFSTHKISEFISNLTLKKNTKYGFSFTIDDRSKNQNDSIYYEFWTYLTLNYTKSSSDIVQLQGDPQATSSFNFSSTTSNIKIQFLEPINLSNNLNLSSRIKFSNNLVHINTTDSKFNKAARIFFNNLLYQTTPVVLKNGIVCSLVNCKIESYSSGTLKFNVTGFSNYSTISNSILNTTNSTPYVGKQIYLYANYTRYNDTNPISNLTLFNGTCKININSQNYNLTYNSTSNLYQINITPYLVIGNHNYQISCLSTNYDDKSQNKILNLIYQPIDNFRSTRSIIKKSGDFYLTENKLINVTITSSGTNNTNTLLDTKYYFLISRDYKYNDINWTSTSNLTSWIDIGKNEFFRLENFGGVNTTYTLQNSSIYNISEYIFIDKQINKSGTFVDSTLYVNIKACVPGGFCKYNSTNYLTFLDTTSPIFLKAVNVSEFYNRNNLVNFSFHVRDLESGINLIKFGVGLNSTIINANNLITNFTSNQPLNYSQAGFNLIEGKYYKIRVEAYNPRMSASPAYNISAPFLIDTIAPYNSSFNITLNNNSYQNKSLFNVTFDIGVDYNFNYTILNKKASGIDYMTITIQNSTLSNNICSNPKLPNTINKTFTKLNTTYQLNLTTAFCYNISYNTYDKAKNVNITNFNKIIKIDTTKPIIQTPLNEFPPNRVEKSIFELNNQTSLFTLSWNILDLESTVEEYEIKIYDNTTGSFVYNTTIFNTSSFQVKYNSTFIKDGTTYISYVRGKNKAGIYSDYTLTDGVSFYILKIPINQLNETIVVLDSNSQTNYYKILDTTNDNITQIKIFEKNNYNTTCRWYNQDLSYSAVTGNLCLGSSTSKATCDLDLSTGDTTFSISCINEQFVNAYNNQSTNIDIEVFVEENDAPQIISINGNTSYPKIFNLIQNENLNLEIIYNDLDTISLYNAKYQLKVQNLTINYTGSNILANSIKINFIQNNLISNPQLLVKNNYYNFTYNTSLNLSKIKQLNDLNLNSTFKISYTNPAQNITENSYNLIDKEISYISGVTNKTLNATINTNGYNFTINNYLSQNKLVLSWDLENYTIDKDLFNITVILSDGLLTSYENLTINITPIINLKMAQNQNIISDNKNILLNFTTYSNMSEIYLVKQNTNEKYLLCQNNCNKVENNYTIIGLENGTNNFEIQTIDYSNILYKKLIVINFTLDSDNDLTPNYLDTDADGDAILDNIDKILWTNKSVYTNIANGSFYVNNSNNFSIEYNSTYQVLFKSNSTKFVLFNYNFSNKILNLLDVAIIYNNSNNLDYLIIKGLENISKEAYLPKSIDTKKTIACISNLANINSVYQFSNICDGANEYRVNCTKSNTGNYNCLTDSQNSSLWKITGLTNSAIKLICSENWQTGSWSTCSSGTQSRTVTDLNLCGTTFTKPITTQSCTITPPQSGGSGGGSSGGGGGGSSYVNYRIEQDNYKPNITTPIQNNNNNNNNNNTNNLVTIPLYIANFDKDTFEKTIILENTYSFNFKNKIYEGKFSVIDSKLQFTSSNGNLEFIISFGDSNVDLDNDGIDDIKFNLENSGFNYILSGISINQQPITNPNSNQIPQDNLNNNDNDILTDTKQSNTLYYILAIILVIIIAIAVILYIKNREPKHETFNYVQTVSNQEIIMGQVPNRDKIHLDLNNIEDKLFDYTNFFKSIMIEEKSMLNNYHQAARKLVEQGVSWTDIYIYLKAEGVSKHFIEKIVNFDYLIDNFEKFIKDHEISSMSQDVLKRTLLSQNWFTGCYIYDGDGSTILRKILFMITGVNIYGFKREKFLEILNEEFKYGLKNTSKENIDLSHTYLNDSNLKKIIELQNKLNKLKVELKQLKHDIEFSDLQNKEEYFLIILDLINDIETYLK